MVFSILGIRLKNSKDEQSLLGDRDISLSLHEITSNKTNDNEQLDNIDIKSETTNSEGGEYELYSKIETHMSISSSLYILNLQGCNIIKSINKEKLPYNESDVQRVYNEFEYVVNENRVSNDLYTNLLNILDSVMFEECGELDSFFVKEEEYTLESLYYKQGSWVCELEWDEQQTFMFSNRKGFDEGECMYLLMYVNKYMKLLSSIENQYNNIKLSACIDKLKDKLRNIHYVITSILKKYIEIDKVMI